jgi:dienelactone hydrolase
MRKALVCSILLLTRMQAAEPTTADAWLAKIKIAPPLNVPASLDAWQQQRTQIRAKLNELLGDLPPRPPVSAFQVISREDKGTYTHETIQFDNGAGEIVKGFVFVPKSATPQSKGPAILYCHWHGGQYDNGKNEMVQTNATPKAPGPTLAEAGYVVLGIDAPCFGERNGHGPDGPQQKGSNGEMTAAKFNLWAGRTLWGMIVRDDLTALDYLCSRPEVDAKRIGVTGMSMGSTRSWWIMAMDDRPRAAVCVGCMTRYEELIRAGMLKAHGIYYFVPGMLKHFDSEAVIALAAPRAMLFMTGDQDGGSPIDGVKKIGEVVSKVYALHGDEASKRFENAIYPGVGHDYLPEMWEKNVKWMNRWLKGP